ncbi:DNA-binding response regulator [Asanoa ishikariensis]|uniref:Two-component system, OmpR family, response regulator MprA n=1 Tax=Asanoa ishikariensis TaxID=137265 RepID=A0A1H3M3Y3_9ACTN|nr:response regulator transcription factor [Asanoa ishikariensis]GIF65871.1 DNA-binding response regulator [Asanoa ishikariensis]SDY70929.1 two-component system, OmpR family, response regulator MprA [Asanoa ishikariensis]
MTAARVLVVEDDARVAAALRRSLEYAGYPVTLASDGPAGLASAIRSAPDLVVLDVNLPGLDGFGVCRALRASGATALVLMLTARDATADRVSGLDAGADDYLVKPFAPEELLARVRALLRRAPAPAEVLRFADLVVDPSAREVRRGVRPVELTALEFDLLAYLVRHPRQVLRRSQLLSAVWGGEPVASNVVDVYIGYLRAKLEAGGEARLVQTVRGVGYVLR